MSLRSSLTLGVAAILPFALAASMFAQPVPNPVLPGPAPTGLSGDGLTRDALDAPEASHAAPAPAPARVAAPHRSTTRRAAVTSRKKTNSYATITHRHRHHKGKARSTMIASTSTAPAPARKSSKQRAPLVSFIYWWNGWVMRTFHTRSGTVLLDTVGARS